MFNKCYNIGIHSDKPINTKLADFMAEKQYKIKYTHVLHTYGPYLKKKFKKYN